MKSTKILLRYKETYTINQNTNFYLTFLKRIVHGYPMEQQGCTQVGPDTTVITKKMVVLGQILKMEVPNSIHYTSFTM